MAKCVKLQRTKTQVCSGNLNKYIEIFERKIGAPINSLGSEPDYLENFILLYSLWAMVQTPRGPNIFDSVNIDKSLTTIFYIRFVPNITAQNWVVYDNERYQIIRVTNMEKNNLSLKLECVLKGAISKEATKA